jgi:hypothetical protein
MKQIIVTVLLLAVSFSANSQKPSFSWAKDFGGKLNDVVKSTALDAAGNIYVAGTFGDTVDFDLGPAVLNLISNGGTDVYVMKISPSGNILWAKSAGGTGAEVLTSIAIDQSTGSVVAIGSFNLNVDFDPSTAVANLNATVQDIFIWKLDLNGSYQWATQTGSKSFDQGEDVTVDNGGYIYATGYFTDTVDFNPGAGIFNLISRNGSMDAYIAKFTSSGSLVWAKNFGGDFQDQSRKISLGRNADVFISGSFSGAPDFDPGSSTFQMTNSGSSDLFISRFDTSGTFIWAGQMGGDSYINGAALTTDRTGAIYLSGQFDDVADFNPGTVRSDMVASGTDAFIVKLKPNGQLAWHALITGDGSDGGRDIIVDNQLNVFCVGDFSSRVGFNTVLPPVLYHSSSAPTGYLFKLDSLGNYIWSEYFGVDGNNWEMHLLINASSTIYLAGTYSTILTSTNYLWGTNVGAGVTSRGNRDSYIMALGGPVANGNASISSGRPKLVLFPNPSDDYFNLISSTSLSSGQVIIRDANGKVVPASISFQDKSARIEFTGCPGTYALDVYDRDKKRTESIRFEKK